MDFWAADFEHKLGQHVANMHLNKFMSEVTVKLAVKMLQDATELIAAVVLEEAQQQSMEGVTELFATTRRVVNGLFNVQKTCEVQCETFLTQVPRPKLGAAREHRKHFAFFSITSLITDVLQNDAAARRHILATSADWSSGKYFNVPATRLASMTDGERFRRSALARPTTANSKWLRVRVWLDVWSDDMTVRKPLCARATALANAARAATPAPPTPFPLCAHGCVTCLRPPSSPSPSLFQV